MNTSKQINIIVALIFMSIVATGAYWMWDPDRADRGKEEQLDATLERAAYLFSANCRSCHGDSGEGGSAANRLKVAPPLNRPDLQGKAAAGGEVDNAAKAQAYKLVFNTISCGRIGKSMPTWGQANGGTLNDEQMRQLTTFITEGSAWDEARHFAEEGYPPSGIHGDAEVPFALAQAIGVADTTVKLSGDISALGIGDRLEIDDELLPIEAVDAASGTVTVGRGFGTTQPAAHSLDAKLLKRTIGSGVPAEPPAITQPACGQNLPAGGGGATPTPEAPSATLSITGLGTAFDKANLYGLPGVPLTVTFDNQDAIAHNIAFYNGEDATADVIAGTDIEVGPLVQTLELAALDAGSYFYQCDVHPGLMEGFLVVGEASAAPAAEATPAP
ncbi:MAG: c-type cytochrome [Chloroflexi bacterium]|nr:c-type cytochrome [Chloroflexota bacterium]